MPLLVCLYVFTVTRLFADILSTLHALIANILKYRYPFNSRALPKLCVVHYVLQITLEIFES